MIGTVQEWKEPGRWKSGRSPCTGKATEDVSRAGGDGWRKGHAKGRTKRNTDGGFEMTGGQDGAVLQMGAGKSEQCGGEGAVVYERNKPGRDICEAEELRRQGSCRHRKDPCTGKRAGEKFR